MSDELREKLHNILKYANKEYCPKPACPLLLNCSECATEEILSLFDKPLPTNEEIHIKIVDVLFGELSVPKFREWLKERFR